MNNQLIFFATSSDCVVQLTPTVYMYAFQIIYSEIFWNQKSFSSRHVQCEKKTSFAVCACGFSLCIIMRVCVCLCARAFVLVRVCVRVCGMAAMRKM